jgi:ribosomal protein S12 methylthiotransferase accessory factor
MFLDLGGTVRAHSPQQTLAKLRPLLPDFGITRVIPQEGLGNSYIPVSVACRPNSRLLSTSQGKGVTRELADISAIMEAIEMYHAERMPAPAVVAPIAEMRGSGRPFLDPMKLNQLPRRSLYSETEPLGWIEVKHVRSGKLVLCPRCIFTMDGTTRRSEIVALALSVSSNGLASGNTLEEALVHGLYELIERHAVYEYRYTLPVEERTQRLVDLETFRGVPHIDDLLARLDAAGQNVWAVSMHGDLGVPVYTAQIGDKSPLKRRDREYGGFGAHYIPEIALSRAITEAVQSRITVIGGSRDDFYPWTYQELELDDPSLADHGMQPVLTRDTVPRPPRFSDFSEVLEWTLRLLESHGIVDTCYFDHTRPEYGNIPVVSVVSPGLLLDLGLVHPLKRK